MYPELNGMDVFLAIFSIFYGAAAAG